MQVICDRCGAGPFDGVPHLRAHRKNPKKCKVMHILLPLFSQQVIEGTHLVIEGTNLVISAVCVGATQLGYAKV